MCRYLILVPAVFLSVCLSTAQAQSNRKNLMAAVLSQRVSVADVQEITLAPGQATPKHLHPCPVIGYIVNGRVLFQLEEGNRVILEEGDAFYEPRNNVVLHFDNLTEAPVKFIAIYLKEDKEENIRLLKQ